MSLVQRKELPFKNGFKMTMNEQSHRHTCVVKIVVFRLTAICPSPIHTRLVDTYILQNIRTKLVSGKYIPT